MTQNKALIQRLKEAGEAIPRTCEHCSQGHRFDARTDEIERYGPDVMGCTRRNFEGYTKHGSTCEAFHLSNQGQSNADI